MRVLEGESVEWMSGGNWEAWLLHSPGSGQDGVLFPPIRDGQGLEVWIVEESDRYIRMPRSPGRCREVCIVSTTIAIRTTTSTA